MATITIEPHYYYFGFQGLAPGAAKWVSFSSKRFEGAAIVFTASPDVQIGGSDTGSVGVTTMSVSEVFISTEPILSSGGVLVGSTVYAGANLKNSGSRAMKYAVLQIAAIQA